MVKSKKKEQVYKSMKEFEEKFFPNSFKEQSAEVPTDTYALGISLAKESLDAIRHQLSK